MLSKKEKKAIDNFKFFNEGDYITREMAESKDIVLKIIQKHQEEVEKKDFTNKQYKEQLEEAEWKINKLADMVAGRSSVYWNGDEVMQDVNKQYFKRKVEEEE